MKNKIIQEIVNLVDQLLHHIGKTIDGRAADIFALRYGIGENTSRHTLQSIASSHGNLSRERIRQIVEDILRVIKESELIEKSNHLVESLKKDLAASGSIVKADQIHNHLKCEPKDINAVSFYLELHGNIFFYVKENKNFHECITIDHKEAREVFKALANLSDIISPEDLISEKRIVSIFTGLLKYHTTPPVNTGKLISLLSISKTISVNVLGEWGKSDSPFISPSAVYEYAYITLKRKEVPLHFSEIAKTASELFGKQINKASLHNQIIKDERFVLVGRGIYALKEWGFNKGDTIDVIKEVLKDSGPLTFAEIEERVLEKRQVKKSTVYAAFMKYKSTYFEKKAGNTYDLIAK